MRRALLTTVLTLSLTGCGPDKPSPKEPRWTIDAERSHHDYSLAWIYTVGEVDAPSANECTKAVAIVEAEMECVGAACKYGRDLVSDYQYACHKIDKPKQLQHLRELGEALRTRSEERLTDCVREVDDWLSRGCGADGACEAAVQSWATRCAGQTKTPLALQLLQRLIENSFGEARRVKLDVRGCDEFSKKLEQAATCSKPFDCEDALPTANLYLERCMQGQRKAATLMDAIRIEHIRLGAGKEATPIPLSDVNSKVSSLPATLALADRSGAVVRVCGEPIEDLAGYLSQRSACQSGEVEFLLPVKRADGMHLELQKRWHENDVSFSAAYPALQIEGEAAARGQKAIEAFAAVLGELPAKAAEDFNAAFERANAAYAAVAPELRQSPKLYSALAQHDRVLSEMFGLIGEQKVSLVNKRTTNPELVALFGRANRFVFSDLTRQGSVEIGKNCDLSELALERVVPTAFAAYQRGLARLKSLVAQRRLTLTEDPEQNRAQVARYAEACSAARDRIRAAREKLGHCSETATACGSDERAQWFSALQKARGELSLARVGELTSSASANQADQSSPACRAW